MKAICKHDYLMRMAMVEIFNKEENGKLPTIGMGRSANVNQVCSYGIHNLNEYVNAQVKKKVVGYYESYCILFSGKLKNVIREFARDVFEVQLRGLIYAFVDVNPSQIRDGVHDISVYGNDCRLYAWRLGGDIRGHIVLKCSDLDNVAVGTQLQSALVELRRGRYSGD